MTFRGPSGGSVNRKRAREERLEEKENQHLIDTEWEKWEQLEAIADDHDLLEIAKAISLSEAEVCPTESSATSPRSRCFNYFGSKVEQDLQRELQEHIDNIYRLKHEFKQLKHDFKALQRENRSLTGRLTVYQKNTQDRQDNTPVNPALVHSRKKGKRLSAEEHRAVLHCYEICKLEKAQGMSVPTVDPILRTAVYFGMSHNTVRDVLNGTRVEDLRGKKSRQSIARLVASDLRQIATSMNLKGEPVTIDRLRSRLEDKWGGEKLLKRGMIRKTMISMGFKYKNTGKAKNFVETQYIKRKRHHYLQERYSDKYKDALFVWIDESYCNQHHVNNMSWYTEGMTVKRSNKGRRYIIVHTGSELGWIGEPKIWVANDPSGDYHKNMNSEAFEEYFLGLCRFCAKEGHPKVVFCMDNAKYHRREATSINKCLSSLRKAELIQRLVDMGANGEAIKGLTVRQLKDMAKEERFKPPLVVEEIAK
ncbi:hypothetical protein BGZ46_008431, partial [Entomortierella lignicola]